MRTIFGGFILGYLMIALVIAPAVMCALNVTPSYRTGVVTVLERSGVLQPVRDSAREAAQFRDRMLTRLSDFVDSKLTPHAPI
ncbi:MAG: hypothetical protein WDN25_18845 [Acetobacteraceae bacterium]